MKKAVVFVLLAMVVIGSCAAQSANDAQRVVGTWVSEDGKNTIVFNANGTGTYNGKNFNYGIFASAEIYITDVNLTVDGINWFIFGEIEKLGFSPDGKRMFINVSMYQKK